MGEDVSATDLLTRRLVLITGKGGTGKTSVTAAIGRVAAERGRRTLLVEIDSHQPAFTGMLGRAPTYAPEPIAPSLFVCNITWREALEEWLGMTIGAQRIVRLILGNRMVQLFLDATPGAREVVILSKIASLADEWDTVLVDMPASGHAVSLLRVPRIALKLMKAGPIRKRSQEVIALLARHGTAMVLVALPEEMVVNETLETFTAIRKEVPELDVALVVLNRAVSPTLTEDERALLERLAAKHNGDGPEGELLRAGRWEADLERSTAEALERLAAEVRLPVLQFPRLGVLGGFEGGSARVVQQMAAALAREVAREARS